MKVGDIIKHPKYGDCEVIRIDNKSYSILMLMVGINTKQVNGGTIQDIIYRPAAEFTI